jgi:hypothetical protein
MNNLVKIIFFKQCGFCGGLFPKEGIKQVVIKGLSYKACMNCANSAYMIGTIKRFEAYIKESSDKRIIVP